MPRIYILYWLLNGMNTGVKRVQLLLKIHKPLKPLAWHQYCIMLIYVEWHGKPFHYIPTVNTSDFLFFETLTLCLFFIMTSHKVSFQPFINKIYRTAQPGQTGCVWSSQCQQLGQRIEACPSRLSPPGQPNKLLCSTAGCTPLGNSPRTASQTESGLLLVLLADTRARWLERNHTKNQTGRGRLRSTWWTHALFSTTASCKAGTAETDVFN